MSDQWARLTLSTYRFVGSAIYPFMGPFLRLRANRGKEDRKRRYERYGYASADRPAGPLVWFHAASVGESMAVMPLIERIDELGIRSIMTTGTVTSAEVVRQRLPASTFHQYVPLDFGRAVRRFLDHWRPDLAIFTESEIWPTTILEMGARRIPQVLVNARMSDRSFARWSQAPALASALFDNVSHVIAQSEIDAERFRHLGARPVTISGNLKVDTAGLPVDPAELSRIRGQIGSRPVWVAASTHPGEEEIALQVHQQMLGKVQNLLTIIVPRHPERGGDVAQLASRYGFNVSMRGINDRILPQTDVFVGDTIGEMGLYLRLGQVAFMGRSLSATGGQNPLEPAMIGTPILSGKAVHNFRDAYSNLLSAGAARLVRDTDMLAANVEYLLRNPDERTKMIEAARRVVEDMRGALDRTVEVLDAYIFPLTVKRDLEGL
jgi:3-deoxy-D-manno-octulosonic-acid transferase